MKRIAIVLFIAGFVKTANAQTDEAMLKWLNGHLAAIDVTKSESHEKSYSTIEKRKITDVRFTKFGAEANSLFNDGSGSVKTNLTRQYFLKATIENEMLQLHGRFENVLKLHIKDAALREKYKEVFTRFAYTRLNTNETDLPIYEDDNVDTKAVFPGGQDEWIKFVTKHFYINPAIKYDVPAGRYKGTISFTVTRDSVIKDFKRAPGSLKGIQESMFYVASKMPRWIPATLNGKNVSSVVSINITIDVPVLGDDFEDQMLKKTAKEYIDRDFNTPNYESRKPGYLDLKPLNLDDNSKPVATTVENEVKPTVTKKTETTTDIKLEKWITEPVAYFDGIRPFNEGLASVYFENAAGVIKYGFINRDGKLIVPLKYDKTSDFSHGLAHVSLKDKHGFIDPTGKLVIPMTWDYASDFSDGLALVTKGKNDGYIDVTGKVIIPVNLYSVQDFHEGLAPTFNKNGKNGYIDKSGTTVIETKYESVQDFCEGLAVVKMDGKFAYIDKTGESARGFIYTAALKFSEGLAVVQTDRLYGFINNKEEVVIPFKYNSAHSFQAGLSVVNLNKKWGAINNQGKVVVPFIYDDPLYFGEGLARISVNDKIGFVNSAGVEVIKPRYDVVGFPREGLIAVSTNNRWIYIDYNGHTVIHEIFDNAKDFLGGLAKVEKNGKTFIIDRTGKKWEGPRK